MNITKFTIVFGGGGEANRGANMKLRKHFKFFNVSKKPFDAKKNTYVIMTNVFLWSLVNMIIFFLHPEITAYELININTFDLKKISYFCQF